MDYYEKKYISALRTLNVGAKVRGFIFGYDSKIFGDYFDKKMAEIISLKEEAESKNLSLHSSFILGLESKLFHLGVKRTGLQLGLSF